MGRGVTVRASRSVCQNPFSPRARPRTSPCCLRHRPAQPTSREPRPASPASTSAPCRQTTVGGVGVGGGEIARSWRGLGVTALLLSDVGRVGEVAADKRGRGGVTRIARPTAHHCTGLKSPPSPPSPYPRATSRRLPAEDGCCWRLWQRQDQVRRAVEGWG